MSPEMPMTTPISAYKAFRREVEPPASSWFKNHGKETQRRRPYILADKTRWKDNIILPEVAELATTIQPLHRWIHHGLSSQAMLINLFGPLMLRDDLGALADAFSTAGVKWPEDGIHGRFEVEDRSVFNERQAQPTSLDFAIGSSGCPETVFIEAKFVEQEFGGCSAFGRGDCDGSNPASQHGQCYLHTIGRKYWEVMDQWEISKGPIGEGPFCAFANHYQFFREVGFALSKGGQMVFLYDERNPVFVTPAGRGLLPHLRGLLPRRVSERVFPVTIQAVIATLSGNKAHNDWVGEFKSKYGLA